VRLDRTTLTLFGEMPREVGQQRSYIDTTDKLTKYVMKNSGTSDCFVSTTTLDGLITEIFTDIDSPLGIEGAIEDFKKLYKWLIDHAYNAIAVATGKKGFHIHVRLKPKRYIDAQEARRKLKNATMWMLAQAFGYDEKTKIVNTRVVDPKMIGDIRRICRIPNTLRPPENNSWCVYLPQYLEDLDVTDITRLMKAPQEWDGDLWEDSRLPALEDFHTAPEGLRVICDNGRDEIEDIPDTGFALRGNIMLKNLLRPCLYRRMIRDNPPHEVRVAATADLLQFFSPSDILNMYKTLNWIDFDADYTAYQIASIKGLTPYSCTRLRQLGIPKTCCVE